MITPFCCCFLFALAGLLSLTYSLSFFPSPLFDPTHTHTSMSGNTCARACDGAHVRDEDWWRINRGDRFSYDNTILFLNAHARVIVHDFFFFSPLLTPNVSHRSSPGYRAPPHRPIARPRCVWPVVDRPSPPPPSSSLLPSPSSPPPLPS